jgi:hypothetical protein
MTMINLKDCTLIIPVKIEHPDRYRNAKTVLGFINEHMETNVFIYEICEKEISKLDFLGNLKNLKIKHWKVEDEGVFHRTKYLNIMLDDVETPVVANYDIDVIIPSEFYEKIVDSIKNGDSDVIYPYKFGPGGQRRVLDHFDYEKFYESGFSLEHIDVAGPWSDYDSEYGHCIFFNTGIYKKYGAENEDFVSYGPEDKERGERFKKMGFNVYWASECKVYHFEHHRGIDSSDLNPKSKENWTVFEKCRGLNKDQIIEYYRNQEYNKKYKTIGKW